MNLHGLDLNLLPILRALLEEAHITRAASRVGLSQPAMSNALARLRKTFDDPLLIRAAGRMQLTPKAEALQFPLIELLTKLEHEVLQQRHFEAHRWQGTVTLLLNDYSELVVMPHLVARISSQAPDLKIICKIMGNEQAYPRIASGEVDLAINYFPDCPQGFYRRRLYEDSFVTLARENHPRIKNRLSLSAFLKEKHILISPRGDRRGVVDDLLQAKGLKRQISVVVGHFTAAPLLVAQSNYLTTLPTHTILDSDLPVLRLPTPIVTGNFSISMIWNERTHRDPAQRWFREQVVASLEALESSHRVV